MIHGVNRLVVRTALGYFEKCIGMMTQTKLV